MNHNFLHYMRNVRRLTNNPIGELAFAIRQQPDLTTEFNSRAEAFRYFATWTAPGVLNAFEEAWRAYQVWTLYQRRQGSKFKK